MKQTSIVCGAIGGFMLFVVIIFSGYLPLLSNQRETNIPLLELVLLLSVVITIVSISYKYHSIKHSLFRTAILFVVTVLTFVFAVQLGMFRYLDRLLQIEQRDSENMAPGISMAVVFCVSLQAAIATNVFLPIGKAIKAMLFKKQKG